MSPNRLFAYGMNRMNRMNQRDTVVYTDALVSLPFWLSLSLSLSILMEPMRRQVGDLGSNMSTNVDPFSTFDFDVMSFTILFDE